MIGEAIGNAIGSLASAGINAYNAYKQREAQRQARNKLEQQQEKARNTYAGMLADTEDYYERRGSVGSEADAQTYADLIRSYNPEDYVADFDEYTYGKSVEDFLNPYYDKIIGETAKATQHTAAGAGLGRGTGAALNIASDVAKKEDELYKTALQEYNTDRAQDYKEYADYITNTQNKLNALQKARSQQLAQYGDLAQDYYGVMDEAQAAKNAITQDKLAADQSYAAAMAGLV